MTLKKNDRSGYTTLKLFMRMSLDALAFLKLLMDNGWNHALAIPKAHIAFYKTKSEKSEKKDPNLSAIYKGSIVWEHFFRGKKKFSQLKKGFS